MKKTGKEWKEGEMSTIEFLRWVNSHTEYALVEEILEHYVELDRQFKKTLPKQQQVEVQPMKWRQGETYDVKLMKYTEKSYVLLGESKAFKDSLKEFGCKWCSTLAQPGFEGKKGWVFPASKCEKFKQEFQMEISTD